MDATKEEKEHITNTIALVDRSTQALIPIINKYKLTTADEVKAVSDAFQAGFSFALEEIRR